MICASMAISRVGNEVIDDGGWRDDMVGGDEADRYDVLGTKR